MYKRHVQLARAYAQRAAERWNETDDMAFLNSKLGKYMPEDSPVSYTHLTLPTIR